MHDANGKELKTGDEILTYRYGLVKVRVHHAGTVIWPEGDSTGYTQEGFRKHIPEAIKVRTWKELAAEALTMQDASNLSGIAHDFSHVVREVKARLEAEGLFGNSNVHKHPIITLWVNKMADLTYANSITRYGEALKWAEAKAHE